MDHNLLHLSARIRAFCIALALLLLPGAMQAEEVYLLTAENINGTEGNYNVPPSNHQFTNTSGSVYTYTITSMPATGFSFRIGVKGWVNNMQPYTNDDPLTINGASYKIQNGCYGEKNSWKVSYTKDEYESLTITVDLKNGPYVKITGVKSSTGGGATTTCAPGLYIAGDKYGKTGDQYIYKLQRNKDKQYYISLNAINGAEWSNVQSYSTQQGIDNYYVRTIGQTYHLVYIDDQGKETDYYPSTNGYTLKGSDTNKGSDKTNRFSTTTTNNWEIGVLNSNDANGGIYNFYVNTDVNGVPQNWYYEADQTKVVAYEVNESTHTTDAYLYCTRANTTGAYKKNFFGMVSFVKDGYLSFLFADKTYGRRKNSNNTYDQDAAADSPNAFQFSKDHLDTGIYTTEFNPTRDYIIAGEPKPTRIFIIGSALNSNLSDTFTDWDPSNATEMVYDVDEGCYKATVTLTKDKQFRFLLDHNQSGVVTSLDNNFGEDSNKPGAGGDTDYNNKVQVESSSSAGENIVFNPETDTYIVRFYVERKAEKTGFQWTNDYGIYRYTIEKPERLNATITPATATVPFGTSLTPKVNVVGTDNETRTYAYTLDGSNPTIDPTTGEGTGSTKVVTYTYDKVIPANDLTTFYMSTDNKLCYIDADGNEQTLTGNTVTVKVQAVQTITSGSKYRLEGDIATGNYIFNKSVHQATADYTISVTNDNTGTTPSINKATAKVVVTNTVTKTDDGVDVFYTTDGSDPAVSTTARLVRNRAITIYAPNTKGNKLRVAIAGSSASETDNNKTHASCSYDITYSTSEGGYQNYLSGDQSVKTLGGDGHVVVYVKPFSSDNNIKADDRIPFIYAYERVKDGASYATKSLTSPHHLLNYNDTHVTVGEETGWRYVDLEPVSGYKDVNVILGYTADGGQTYKTTEATVANACKDMFLTLDVATGQVTDVTHQYTGDYFYTTGKDGTKIENANPAEDKAFCYVQVPLAWTTNGNSVKVFNGEAEYTEAKVNVQPGAQTSEFSSVCKINIPTSLEEKTELTIRPYKGDVASKLGFDIIYQNGGYYFYESDKHKSSTAPLVFAQDKSGDKDQRSYGRHDFNHLQEVGNGDLTHALNKVWTSTPEGVNTTTVKDNWTGSEATVYVIPAGTTNSQTVTGLVPGTPYTVQMIVRGENGATGKLSLNDATEGTATDNKTFTGYDAQGTVTTDGRVEALLSGTNNGWQKLEAVANATADGKLTISLAATDAELQLSDVTLLDNANTDGHVWTKAPTSNDVTECDLSNRSAANSFSFFDRGDNKNAIIYANANTVLGMSSNTYDVAVESTNAKGSLFSKESSSVSSGDEPGYTMNKLVLTDQAQDGTTAAGDVDKFYASGWNYGTTYDITAKVVYFDRTFSAGVKAAVCFPFSLTQEQLEKMFGTGAKAYSITNVDANKLEVTFAPATGEYVVVANTPCLIEPGSNYSASAEVAGSFSLPSTSGETLLTQAGTGYTFNGTYEYKKVLFNSTEHCYSFDPTYNGRFKYVSKSKGGIVKPFRAYIKEDNTNSPAKVFNLVIDNTVTNIEEYKFTEASNAPIYSITGVLVSASGNKEGLAKGIYLQNGKKFIITK